MVSSMTFDSISIVVLWWFENNYVFYATLFPEVGTCLYKMFGKMTLSLK